MKNLLFTISCICFLCVNTSFGQSDPAKDMAKPAPKSLTTMTFDQEVFEFGSIKEGESVSHTFKFTNTGNAPLKINKAKSTCGCTVPDWPKNPIAPGKTGEIKVIFNSKGKAGVQKKPVYIYANTAEVTKVFISGKVIGDGKTPSKDLSKVGLAKPNPSNKKPVTRRPATANKIIKPTGPLGEFKFFNEKYDYGVVNSGDVVTYTFNFKNVGEAPITIKSAKSTCGCTVPSFPKAPIAVGEYGQIMVTFNTRNKRGNQRKPVNIIANTDPQKTAVWVEGFVEKGDDHHGHNHKAGHNHNHDHGDQHDKDQANTIELVDGPKLQVATSEINIGEVPAGEKATLVYTLKNIGSKDLTIKKIKPKKDVKIIEEAATVLTSGQSTYFKIEYMPTKSGAQSSPIKIITNGGKQNASVKCTIK